MSPPRRRSPLATRIVPSVEPAADSPRRVANELSALVSAGARLVPSGAARDDPDRLLAACPPRHKAELFGITLYVTDFRYDEYLNFLVAYVVLRRSAEERVRRIHPRIIYKDSSLVWRVASHVVHNDDETWIGKGDVKWIREAGETVLSSAEETTNLPYELQAALDTISRRRKARRDDDAIHLVLRPGSSSRLRAFADFTAPRERAAAEYVVNGGRPVARFTRRGDPGSLRFAPGFEPDFGRGVLEETRSGSRFYGGAVRKFRVLSTNRLIQYQFVASPTHAFVNPPQTLTTELTTFAVRPLDVPADDDAFIPGYEYHFFEDEGEEPELHSQIPPGFAGAPSPLDPLRADAAPWVEALPVIREFRRRVLRRRRTRRRSKA